MPVTTKVRDFVEDVAEKVHNLGSDNLAIALSNTAPASESSNPTLSGNGVLANVTQISYTNYSDDMTVDRRLQSVTSTESSGTYTLDAADITITASGGALPTFRYIYLYNDTPTSPADPLILVIDNEAGITLASGESVTLQFNGSGILTLA
jgi:hypothetical protein